MSVPDFRKQARDIMWRKDPLGLEAGSEFLERSLAEELRHAFYAGMAYSDEYIKKNLTDNNRYPCWAVGSWLRDHAERLEEVAKTKEREEV